MFAIYVIWGLIVIAIVICVVVLVQYGHEVVLSFLNTNSDAIKIFFSLLAVVYAAALYHQDFLGKRIERTLEFSEKKDEVELKRALKSVNDYWIQGEGCEILREVRQNKRTNSEWADSGIRFVRNKGVERDVMEVHNYYTDLAICVSRGRCDHKSACEIFAYDIENFRLTYRRFLKDWEIAYEKPVRQSLRQFHWGCQQKEYLALSTTKPTDVDEKDDVYFSCGPGDFAGP